jgi:hypothetical protein
LWIASLTQSPGTEAALSTDRGLCVAARWGKPDCRAADLPSLHACHRPECSARTISCRQRDNRKSHSLTAVRLPLPYARRVALFNRETNNLSVECIADDRRHHLPHLRGWSNVCFHHAAARCPTFALISIRRLAAAVHRESLIVDANRIPCLFVWQCEKMHVFSAAVKHLIRNC